MSGKAALTFMAIGFLLGALVGTELEQRNSRPLREKAHRAEYVARQALIEVDRCLALTQEFREAVRAAIKRK